MKNIVIAMAVFLIIQQVAITKEITLLDRISHPAATTKHSFAWMLDPFMLIQDLSGGTASPRHDDSVNYEKYITGESDNYYLRCKK